MPGVPGPVTNPCEARLTPLPPFGTADVVRVVREADVELVHRVRSERLRAAERPELRAADRQRVEARHVRAALLPGIRIVERVVVEEVVAGQQPEPRVAVDAERAFVVAHGLRKRAGRELAIARIGLWACTAAAAAPASTRRAAESCAFGNTHCADVVQPGV